MAIAVANSVMLVTVITHPDKENSFLKQLKATEESLYF